MTRINQTPQFSGQFQGSAQSQGFNPESALTTENHEKIKGQRRLQDLKTRETAMRRQHSLDTMALKTEHTKQNANLAMLKGFASLSKTALDATTAVAKQQEQVAKDDAAITAAFGVTEEVQTDQISESTQNAVGQEFANVTHNNAQEEGLESIEASPEVAEVIRHDNNSNIIMQQVQRGNAYSSVTEFPGYHSEYVNNAERVYYRPDGSSFTLGTINSAADIALIDTQARASFYRDADVASMPRAQIASVLAPTVNNTGAGFRTSANNALIKGRTETRVENARMSTEQALAANENIELAFQQGSSALFSSGAYIGKRGAANEDTVKTMLDWAVRNNRPDVIEDLAKVSKRHDAEGKPIKGTDLNRQYGELFENAREGVINERLSDDQRTRAAADNTIVMGERDRQVALAAAETPEQERQINLAKAEEYDSLGTPEGRLKAAQLRAEPNYSPFTALDLKEQQDQGIVLSNEELGGLLDNGEINATEARNLGYNPKGELSADGTANKRATSFKNETKAQGKAAVLAALNVPGTVVKSGDDKRIIMEGTGNSIIEDISGNLQDELQMMLRANPEMPDKDIRDFLTRRGKEMAAGVTADQEGNLSYTFGGKDSRDVNIRDITPTVTIPNSKNKGNMASDFRSFTPQQLSTRGDVAITGDIILNEREMLITADAISRGKPVPSAIEEKARALGTNAETLIRAQYKLLDRQMPAPPEPVRRNGALSSEGRGVAGKYDTGEVIGGVELDGLRDSIIGKESGNNYSAVNPHSGALGYGQVMPANVGPWSREVLGYTISQREFLRNPDLQMQIINGRFRKMMQQQEAAGYTGETLLRRTASIWYSGQGDLYDNTRPQTYGAGSYPSISSYTLDVLARYRG